MSYNYQDPYGSQQSQSQDAYGSGYQSGSGYQQYDSTPYAANPYAGQAGAVQPYNPYAVATLPEHPQSTTVLILGILSITAVQLCGPFAWYFGSKARKELRENPGMYRESGGLTAGWVMGIIGTVFLILLTVFWIIYIIFIVLIVGASSHG